MLCIDGKLAGDTTLTSQLGTAAPQFTHAIYYQLAPPGTGFPFVEFHKQAGTPVYSFKPVSSAFDEEVWMVKGVDRQDGRAHTADPVEGIASRLDALLTGGTLSISGKQLMYLSRESDIDYFEVSDGVEYKHAGALFRVVYQGTA